MKNFNFAPSAVHHVYHRALDKGVIFYSLEDRLVYYTLAAVMSRRHGVSVLAASIMFTHTHQSIVAPSLEAYRCYLHDLESTFVRRYNVYHSRTGSLYARNPGHSQKMSSKEKRTNIIYVYNNHVEKQICTKAVQHRWSFLAYALSDCPFSQAINPDNCSAALSMAIRLVDRRIARSRSLKYKDLDSILPELSPQEREQFTDYVIARYALIDFGKAASLFGNLESLLVAVDSSTGSEYDIREDFYSKSDVAYEELLALLKKLNSKVPDLDRPLIHSVYVIDVGLKERIARAATRSTSATNYQLRAFFHVLNR